MPELKEAQTTRGMRRDYRLGAKPLLILKAILDLKVDAYGLAIMDYVNALLGPKHATDPAHVFMSLKRLRDRGFIEIKDTRRVRSSPPLKVYSVTAEGKRAYQFASEEAEAVYRAMKGGAT